MSRFIISLSVIGFLCWIVLADYLRHLFKIDIDTFWMTVSTIAIISIVSLLIARIQVKKNNEEAP
jgi:uncharacterized membrane protein YvlD (DUF360 family)